MVNNKIRKSSPECSMITLVSLLACRLVLLNWKHSSISTHVNWMREVLTQLDLEKKKYNPIEKGHEASWLWSLCLLLIILCGLPSSRSPGWTGSHVARAPLGDASSCSSWKRDLSSVALPEVSSIVFFVFFTLLKGSFFPINMASFFTLESTV